MIGPELGALLTEDLSTPPSEDPVRDLLLDFLDAINPAELEVRALANLGGLEGGESVGECFLTALKEYARGA